jgi:peroxiredoxin
MKVRPRVWLPLAGSIFFTISAAPVPQQDPVVPVPQNPGATSPPPEARAEAGPSASVDVADVPPAFDPLPRRNIATEAIDEQHLDRLMATLDGLLSRHNEPARRAFDVDYYYRDFVERLQTARLSPAQEARVLTMFDALAERYPTDVEAIARERKTLTTLSIVKVAPGLSGVDLDGVPFNLSDYRGKVVVLAFSGAWCGACRVEYPYLRLLEEIYEGRPFALLGVSSDKDLASARQAKHDQRLTYRTWFDGRKNGAIAAEWGVAAWPTIYVLDKQGVVRFVNLRQEDLLKGVRQLMDEK